MTNSISSIVNDKKISLLPKFVCSDRNPSLFPVEPEESRKNIGDLSMQVNIAGHHVEVTQALHDYVISKLEKLERHFDQVSNIDVILSVEKLVQKAEATVPVNGQNLFAYAEDEVMYAAIDALVDKLDRQIIKRKEKATNHHRGDGTNKRAQI